jgi:hypothetical protein
LAQKQPRHVAGLPLQPLPRLISSRAAGCCAALLLLLLLLLLERACGATLVCKRGAAVAS